jgi:hypothetical protein
MKEEPVQAKPAAAVAVKGPAADAPDVNPLIVVLAWAAVWIPIAWGVWMTLTKAVVLFR